MAARLHYHDRPPFPSEVRMSWSGIILVVVGALLLANNFDLLPFGWLHQWWPLLLIAVGLMTILRPQHGRRSSKVDPADDGARSDPGGRR
jgi:uncharacterized membrane protein YfcA